MQKAREGKRNAENVKGGWGESQGDALRARREGRICRVKWPNEERKEDKGEKKNGGERKSGK